MHLILDNFSAHRRPIGKPGDVDKWLQRHRRVHLHFTPTHASWLNQTSIWFSQEVCDILARRVILRGIFPSIKALVDAIMAFIKAYSEQGKPFKWTMTPERLKQLVNNRTKY